jgi:hypothetical protein|tara:strand:- start:109 stop:270 length:162 start_codon:yes stop_codon:yes gene_type:complete
MGVAGRIEMLNEKKTAEQPIVGLDWNEDKLGLACTVSLDQKCSVVIATKLNLY